MKTKTIAFLTALLLFALAGCNNAPPNEDKPQSFSFSESVQSTSESETPAEKESTEVETTPETEETPSETDFDIEYWISFAKGYAQSVGLLLDSEAVYCCDNPIRAGAHCEYLERDIHSRLDRYKADEEITAVWIWAEQVEAKKWLLKPFVKLYLRKQQTQFVADIRKVLGGM